jgi:transposase
MAVKWSVTQKEIAKLLGQGKTVYAISKQLGVSNSSVTNIKNALAHGDTPEHPKKNIPKPSKPSDKKDVVIPNPNPAEVNKTIKQFKEATQKQLSPEQNIEADTEQSTSSIGAEQTDGDGKQQSSSGPPPMDITTILKLTPVPVNCAITPTMLTFRLYTMKKLGWRQDMPWEDWFDTIIDLLAKSWDVELFDWSEKQPSPPGGTGTGNNGGKTIQVTEEMEKLGQVIANYLVNAAAAAATNQKGGN